MGYLWHVKNWFRVGKNFSWKLSFNTLAGFIGLNDNLRNSFLIKCADKKHEITFSCAYAKQKFAVSGNVIRTNQLNPCLNNSLQTSYCLSV